MSNTIGNSHNRLVKISGKIHQMKKKNPTETVEIINYLPRGLSSLEK